MAAAAAAPTTDPGALAQADTALIGTATPDQASGGALPASAAPEPTPGLLAGAPEAGSAAQAKQSSTPTSLPTLTQPYLAQIATSVNSSPGTTTLDQPPLAAPAGPGTGTQPGGTLLVLGALVLALLIGIGFVLARRRH
jgi:LPXTG-motif cell wall-anchored protein